jgi:chromate transporter
MILLDLFLTFFKIGAFTFGGGYAMLPLIQEEVVAHAWLTETDIINFIAVSESSPGPFAINIATYIGSEMAGIIGAICATLGVVLPSLIIIILVAKFFEKFKTNKIVKGCMTGLKPAVVGLIGASVLSIGKTVFVENGFNFVSLVLFLSISVLAFKKIHPIIIILISALIGIGAGYLI